MAIIKTENPQKELIKPVCGYMYQREIDDDVYMCCKSELDIRYDLVSLSNGNRFYGGVEFDALNKAMKKDGFFPFVGTVTLKNN